MELLNSIADMKLGNVHVYDVDTFGNTCESLITMYAGNEFLAPTDVSELLIRLGTAGTVKPNLRF